MKKRRKSDRPMPVEMKRLEKMQEMLAESVKPEGIIKSPASPLEIAEIPKNNIGLAIQRKIQNYIMRSTTIRPQMIRLMAGESAATFTNSMRLFQSHLSRPEETRVYIKKGQSSFNEYLRIDSRKNKKAPIITSNVGLFDFRDADPLMKMAFETDRVCYVEGRNIYWVDRKDPKAAVHRGRVERYETPVLMIPFSDEMGAIRVTGSALTFGDLFFGIENSITLASDISHLASMNLISRIDPLTGAFNKRAFEKLLEYAIEQYYVDGSPTSLVMCDIDHFKNVNDNYGHIVGDKVLSSFAVITSTALRTFDKVGTFRSGDTPMEQELGRVGGEEFGIVLDQTDLAGAIIAAERCRRIVERSIITDGSDELMVTVSMGIASVPEALSQIHLLNSEDHILGRAGRGKKMLKETADQALYVAKEDRTGQGRNRSVVGHLDRKGRWITSHVTVMDNGTIDYRRVYKKENGL
ncbi:GGDEF domain-containing protein [Candidatus Micrarchaeota archaeon]|nr:GGDEF domain-containing protein [Candidatus Micrarchaeota archaeon]